MKVAVQANGLLIPKRMLRGMVHADVRKENGRIVITPLSDRDPILGLGSDPVDTGLRHAAEHHDKLLYTGD